MTQFALALLLVLSPGCAGNPWVSAQESSELRLAKHFAEGQKAIREGRLERAVEEFKKVVSLEPGLVEARVNLGLAYHMLGQYHLSVSELTRIAAENPKLLAANLFLGIGHLKLGAPEKAAPPLERALSVEPANREARRALAACRLAQDDYLGATHQFRTLFSQESNPEEAWFRLGRDYLDLARQLTRRIAGRHASSSWGHRLAGDLMTERGTWNEAAREYGKALSIDPEQPGLHSAIGSVYLRLGKREEAEAEFRSELAGNPGDEQALLLLAEAQLGRGTARDALESLSKVWRILPPVFTQRFGLVSTRLEPGQAAQLARDVEEGADGPPAHFLLAALYEFAGEAQKASRHHAEFQLQLNAWQSAQLDASGTAGRDACLGNRVRECAVFLESQKNLSFDDRLLLGKILQRIGEHERAADAFAAALAAAKENVEPQYWLARTYIKLADRCFEQLSLSFPDSRRAHQLVAETHRLRMADKEAIEEYQRALRLNPDDPEVHEALGELYLFNNSPEEARQALERALKLNPAASGTLYLFGLLHLSQREGEKAVPYLQDAVRREPGFLEARAALGKAYLRSGQPAKAAAELEKVLRLDYYGDLHHLLYQSYRQLRKRDLAMKALARSQELRKKSMASDQAKLARSIEER